MDFGGLLGKSKGKAAAAPVLELEVDAEEEGDPKLERLLPVADDLMAAIKSGDRIAVAEALLVAHQEAHAALEGDETDKPMKMSMGRMMED